MSYQSRGCIRISTQIPGRMLAPDDSDSVIQVENISVTGLRIWCKKTLQKGDSIILRFAFPKQTEEFELEAKVMRVEKLNASRQGWTHTLGLQISTLTDEWVQTSGEWIQRHIETRSMRRQAALLLAVTSVAFAVKSVLAGVWIHAGLESQHPSTSLMHLIKVGVTYPHLNLVFACLTGFCAWTIIEPRPLDKFFSSNAAIAGAIMLSLRLFLKYGLFLKPGMGWLFLAIDATLICTAWFGAITMQKIERHYNRFQFLLKRETILPANLAVETED